MDFPASSRHQFTSDLSICRVLNGMWQVSGAHGHIDPERAMASMLAHHNAGFNTWDLADHYGPAEDFIGEFRRRMGAELGGESSRDMQAFTKWVPRPATMTRTSVEQNVDRSLRRMDVETLDLLQFHWWDYQDTNYFDALVHLSNLRDSGKIRHLALTNFDTRRLRMIADEGIRVVSNQVQFSVIDTRPEVEMTSFCQEHEVQLLAYGTICGGLLSEKYLGQPEPSRAALNTASLMKYKQMVDAWGSWQLFQEMLGQLNAIAEKYGVSIANVAARYVLERSAVAGVIVGVRLGESDHLEDNARVFEFNLEADDFERIASVQAKAQDLFTLIGDCGDEYRRRY
jgi:aryl-alcohol dehydrogenase-like predicted oxidoreductase